MRRDVLDELRREHPVPETPAPPPVERLLAQLDQTPIPDSRPNPMRHPGWQRVRVGGPLLASVGVTLAIAVGAFVLLRGAGNPTPAPVVKSPGGTIGHLVDILAVLRRPQTPADPDAVPPLRGQPRRCHQRRHHGGPLRHPGPAAGAARDRRPVGPRKSSSTRGHR